DARGFEDADDRFGDFRTDAVAGNQRNRVGHGAKPYSRAYQDSSTNPSARLTSSGQAPVRAAPSQAPRPATASISSVTAMRGKKPCGGGPMNFIVNRPMTTMPPQMSVSDGNT